MYRLKVRGNSMAMTNFGAKGLELHLVYQVPGEHADFDKAGFAIHAEVVDGQPVTVTPNEPLLFKAAGKVFKAPAFGSADGSYSSQQWKSWMTYGTDFEQLNAIFSGDIVEVRVATSNGSVTKPIKLKMIKKARRFLKDVPRAEDEMSMDDFD